MDEQINNEALNTKSNIELLFENLEKENDDIKDEFPSEDEFSIESQNLARHELRQEIYENIADLESLFGTTADATQVLTVMLVIQMEALQNSKTFDEYKANTIKRVEEIAGAEGSFNEYSKQSTSLLSAISEKSIVMPYMVKEDGLMGVIKDVSARATGVAQKIAEKFSK